ncbi:hypothetical protein D3C80_818890 [compost metagenome]
MHIIRRRLKHDVHDVHGRPKAIEDFDNVRDRELCAYEVRRVGRNLMNTQGSIDLPLITSEKDERTG